MTLCSSGSTGSTCSVLGRYQELTTESKVRVAVPCFDCGMAGGHACNASFCVERVDALMLALW